MLTNISIHHKFIQGSDSFSTFRYRLGTHQGPVPQPFPTGCLLKSSLPPGACTLQASFWLSYPEPFAVSWHLSTRRPLLLPPHTSWVPCLRMEEVLCLPPQQWGKPAPGPGNKKHQSTTTLFILKGTATRRA